MILVSMLIMFGSIGAIAFAVALINNRKETFKNLTPEQVTVRAQKIAVTAQIRAANGKSVSSQWFNYRVRAAYEGSSRRKLEAIIILLLFPPIIVPLYLHFNFDDFWSEADHSIIRLLQNFDFAVGTLLPLVAWMIYTPLVLIYWFKDYYGWKSQLGRGEFYEEIVAREARL